MKRSTVSPWIWGVSSCSIGRNPHPTHALCAPHSTTRRACWTLLAAPLPLRAKLCGHSPAAHTVHTGVICVCGACATCSRPFPRISRVSPGLRILLVPLVSGRKWEPADPPQHHFPARCVRGILENRDMHSGRWVKLAAGHVRLVGFAASLLLGGMGSGTGVCMAVRCTVLGVELCSCEGMTLT